MKTQEKQKGFTLLEMIVAIGIFAVIMLIALGALLSVIEANRKARSLQLVIQNLDFALDSMVRHIRTGTTYHCGDTGNLYEPLDCTNAPAGTAFTFEEEDGVPGVGGVGDQVIYRLTGTQIERSNDGGGSYSPITSESVSIEDMDFFVWGAENAALQPRVFISIKGTAVSGDIVTPFHVQTNVTQRVLDI